MTSQTKKHTSALEAMLSKWAIGTTVVVLLAVGYTLLSLASRDVPSAKSFFSNILETPFLQGEFTYSHWDGRQQAYVVALLHYSQPVAASLIKENVMPFTNCNDTKLYECLNKWIPAANTRIPPDDAYGLPEAHDKDMNVSTIEPYVCTTMRKKAETKSVDSRHILCVNPSTGDAVYRKEFSTSKL